MDVLSILLAFVLLATVLGFGFYLNLHSHRSIKKNYQWLADEFGLHFHSSESKGFGLFRSPPYVSGLWDGREISIQTVTTGLSNSRQAETAINLQTGVNPSVLLHLQSRKGLNRLERSEFKGLQQVSGPTPEYDQKIRLMTNHPEWFGRIFDMDFLNKLRVHLGGTSGTILLVKGSLTYRETGLLAGAKSVERIHGMTIFLGTMADWLENREKGEETL